MPHRIFRSLPWVIGMASLVSIPLAGQAPPAPGTAAVRTRGVVKTATSLRTAWGDPDLQGTWTYNQNLQIMQAPGYVAILYEMMREARIIPLDGRPHLAANVRQWLGDSRGRWEGNTLVVETTNFNAKHEFRGATENLRLVERFTRADDGSIDYQFTADDPATWTATWTAAIPLIKTGDQVYEYACHEGNYGMPNLLRSARAEDQAAAAVSSGK